MTYAQLDAAAVAAAASEPLANLATGDRVIVAHPPGLEFSVAAGVILPLSLVLVRSIRSSQGAN